MDSYGWAVAFFLILQTFAVAGRVWVRAVIVKSFKFDDAILLLTLALSLGLSSCLIEVTVLTHNRSVFEFPEQNLVPALKLTLASELLYICGASALKASLGTLLLRVLVKKWQQITIYTTMAVSITYGITYFLLDLFQCGNPNDFPSKILMGECWSANMTDGLGYTFGILNAIADWIFGLLPVALLWNDSMNRRTKISVVIILSIGSAGSIATVVRLAWIHQLTGLSPLFFHHARGIGLVSALELAIGVVCVSLTTYKPFFRRFLRKKTTYHAAEEDGRSSKANLAVGMCDWESAGHRV